MACAEPGTRCQRSGTFLPEVAAHEGWSQMQTMESLIRKAGYHGSARSVLKTLEVGLALMPLASFLLVKQILCSQIQPIGDKWSNLQLNACSEWTTLYSGDALSEQRLLHDLFRVLWHQTSAGGSACSGPQPGNNCAGLTCWSLIAPALLSYMPQLLYISICALYNRTILSCWTYFVEMSAKLLERVSP